MSQGSVDFSSLPCGSSVDGSFRIQRKPIRLMEDSKQLALYLEKPRLRNSISSSTHCDNSIRGGRVGIPDFPFSLIPTVVEGSPKISRIRYAPLDGSLRAQLRFTS